MRISHLNGPTGANKENILELIKVLDLIQEEYKDSGTGPETILNVPVGTANVLKAIDHAEKSFIVGQEMKYTEFLAFYSKGRYSVNNANWEKYQWLTGVIFTPVGRIVYG